MNYICTMAIESGSFTVSKEKTGAISVTFQYCDSIDRLLIFWVTFHMAISRPTVLLELVSDFLKVGGGSLSANLSVIYRIILIYGGSGWNVNICELSPLGDKYQNVTRKFL